MKIYIILLIILIVIILYCIVKLFFNYYKNKNNFFDIPVKTNYNIINYLNEVQNYQLEIQNKNKNIDLAKILLSSQSQSNISFDETPNKIKEYGFESCDQAINYFKNNNLNLFLPTNEIKTPIAEICKSYLSGVNTNNIDNLNNLNNNILNITDDINNNIDNNVLSLKPESMINYLEKRNSQITKDSNFLPDKPIGFIYNFYNNKMKEKLNPNLIPYTDIIYGNFSIIKNQFIQLNNWNIQILSNQIRFIYINTPILSYPYEFSNINTGANFIYIKLLSQNILSNNILNDYEINNFTSFLNDIGFRPNIFIHITLVNDNVYAIKSSNFDTLFLIKEMSNNNRTNYYLNANIN